MKTKAILLLTLLLGVFGVAQAQQSSWNWPEDKKTAAEKNALYTDSKTMGRYREAADALYWLLVNAPDLNPSIYINGGDIYNELAEAAKDPAQKKVYQDSVLTMYDLRIKYFGDEADVLDKKAYYAYKFNKDDKAELEGLYNLLVRVEELKGKEMAYSNAVAFMDVVRRHKLLNKAISDEKALEHYDEVMAVLDHHAEQGNADRIEKYKNVVDDILVKTVEIDCEFVQNNFGPKVKANPDDLELAKKTYKLLRAGGCSDGELYMTTIQKIYQEEPTFGLAEHLAQKHMDKKDYAAAEKYFEDAINMTEDNTKKGEIYFNLARTYGNLGRKSESRAMAYKAMEADPSVASKAYTHIGNLYLNSQECYGQTSLVQDRSIYLAAYKMYQKAGNNSAMETAAKQFPSAEEIFNENMELGQEITVGCWINEKVTLQKR
jgi:tetratricopeptide (TPR) repeat protein